jgi:DNA-binding response OmpR family regulator
MARILLADDDSDLCSFLRDELVDLGHLVTVHRNGADAVLAATEQSFDLAILDMLMPGLDGVQASQVLRKIAPRMPIIGLTGFVGRGYMAQLSNLGITCLSKPISIDALRSEIDEVLAGHSH